MRSAFDLHTHTVHSDGTTDPSTNAALAAEAGLAGFALTDHDTLEGLPEADAASRRLGLELVRGVELSTEVAGASVHLLGYWVDATDHALRKECDRLRCERERRARRMIDLLAAHGAHVDMARVRAIAGSAPIGRPHIAVAMVEAGVVDDIQAAFDLWIGDRGPAYVPKHALAPQDGIKLVRGAGGVAVLAHPGTPGEPIDVPFVQRLAEAGLSGVEVDHPSHDVAARAFWRAVARELDLVATGSSDFHGDRKTAKIGCNATSARAIDSLRSRRPG